MARGFVAERCLKVWFQFNEEMWMSSCGRGDYIQEGDSRKREGRDCGVVMEIG